MQHVLQREPAVVPSGTQLAAQAAASHNPQTHSLFRPTEVSRVIEPARCLLRELLASEAEAAFPLLSQIPAIKALQFVDYYGSLARTRQAQLLEAGLIFHCLRLPAQPGVQQRRGNGDCHGGRPMARRNSSSRGLRPLIGPRYTSRPDLCGNKGACACRHC